MGDMYFGIIVDLVDSRLYKDEKRRSIHENLTEIIDKVNMKFNDQILSSFTITLGDEFQGLVKVNVQVVDLIFDLYRRLREHDIIARFGIGYGEMVLPFRKEISIGSDGPAYHKARKAVDRAKKIKKEFCFFFDEDVNDLLEKISDFYVEIYEKMNSQQKETYTKLLKGEEVETIVEELDYNSSSVSRLSKGKALKLNTYLAVLKKLIENKL